MWHKYNLKGCDVLKYSKTGQTVHSAYPATYPDPFSKEQKLGLVNSTNVFKDTAIIFVCLLFIASRFLITTQVVYNYFRASQIW